MGNLREENFEARIQVAEVKQPDPNSYRHEEIETDLFVVVVKAYSTKELEGKIAKLQEAATHQGWKLK